MSAVSTIPASTPHQPARRVMTNVLAAREKRVLIWLAHRLPAWINSDHLTLLALVSMAAAGGAYALARVTPWGLLLVVVCLAANWFGDSLDGTLARVRDQQRPRYGFYVDHVVDAIGVACLIGGMAASSYMSPAVAAAVLIAYLLLCVEVFLATHVLGTFQMSFFSVGPTELRLLLVVGNLAAFLHPTAHVFGHEWLLFDVGGTVGAVGLVFTFLFAAVRNTLRLSRLEPRPARRA